MTFTDASTNAPATWDWNFNDGSATGTNPTASPSTASTVGPHTVVYDCGGAEGETCVFNVSLTVGNSGGVRYQVGDGAHHGDGPARDGSAHHRHCEPGDRNRAAERRLHDVGHARDR